MSFENINMEKIGPILGYIGTLASIIGAIISIYHSRKAKKIKVQVEEQKELIFKKQTNTELSSLLTEVTRMRQSFGKYSLPSMTRALDGNDYEKDIKEYQNLLHQMNDSKSDLKTIKGFEFDNYYLRLSEVLESIPSDINNVPIKASGKQILSLLNELIPFLKAGISEFHRN